MALSWLYVVIYIPELCIFFSLFSSIVIFLPSHAHIVPTEVLIYTACEDDYQHLHLCVNMC